MKRLGPIIITSVVILIAWVTCGFVLANYDEAGFHYWGGFAFGVIGIIAVFAANLIITNSNARIPVEVNALPLIFSGVYLIICLILNAAFMFKVNGEYNTLLVVLNIVALLIFILIIYYTAIYRNRVSNQLNLIAGKAANTSEIAYLVAGLLSQANDPDVRNKLHSFKEKIDYSSNISQGFTIDMENNLKERLKGIGVAFNDGTPKEQLISLIEDAEQIWDMRNAKISTYR